MAYIEQAFFFPAGQAKLLGILARPSKDSTTGVLVVVGGPQYRAGSHRQFALLARALAAAGYPALRFDCAGMGDSNGEPKGFLGFMPDIAVAIDALQKAMPSVKSIVLWGLCDGASAALLYWQETQDPRIRGLCLLNPWVRSEAGLARTHIKHYYRQRLLQSAFWRKLFSGGITWKAFASLWNNLRRMHQPRPRATGADQPFQQRMAQAWAGFGGDILLLLSSNDLTAAEFIEHARNDPAWAGSLGRAGLQRHDLAGADHTFSTPGASASVERLTLSWLQQLAP